MQTRFSIAQLEDPDIRAADGILRGCVHCGFCNATCPTYLLTGDELDGPRGRIWLIKEMLEGGGPASATHQKHLDRCLSCLSCMTTCPSGVDYMHLVDLARHHVEETGTRGLGERLLRRWLGILLPHPLRVRWALTLARLARPLASLLPERLGAMLALVPRHGAGGLEKPRVVPAEGVRKYRVALLTGCVQQVVAPEINESTIRLLTRHGCEVVVAAGAGCCGALNHHLGQHDAMLAHGRANLAAWSREMAGDGLDAVIANASGCGTMVKDYGFLFRDDAEWAYRARGVSAIARDVAEFLAGIGITPVGGGRRPSVAYQPACSLSHGQQVTEEPRTLLVACGFELCEAADNHLCCGSAGTYNILQPGFAGELRQRKAASLAATGAELVASGNIGCMTQLAPALEIPVVHTVELLDWATGGPKPAALEEIAR